MNSFRIARHLGAALKWASHLYERTYVQLFASQIS
jgi:hypothetical protein